MWYHQTNFLQIQWLPCKSQTTKSLWLLFLYPHPLYINTIFVKAGAYMVLHLSTTLTITYKLLKYLILSAKYRDHWKYKKSSFNQSINQSINQKSTNIFFLCFIVLTTFGPNYADSVNQSIFKKQIWLPNLPPLPSFHTNARRLVRLRTDGLGGYIIKFIWLMTKKPSLSYWYFLKQ